MNHNQRFDGIFDWKLLKYLPFFPTLGSFVVSLFSKPSKAAVEAIVVVICQVLTESPT